jgi:hypothetical protein
MKYVLYFYISITETRAVPTVAVFCISSMSFLSGILLRYLNDFETVPIAPVITFF